MSSAIGKSGSARYRTGSAKRRCCCDSACLSPKGQTSGPYGCLACQCRRSSAFLLCVSGYTGDLAIFNNDTYNVAVRLSRVTSSLFRYEQAGIRKFELEFTATAHGFDDSEIRAYSWDGAAWVLEATVLIWPDPSGNCFAQEFDGAAEYLVRGVGDRSDFTSMTLEFSGVQTDPNLACASTGISGGIPYPYNRRHGFGDINAATYASGAMPAWPNTPGDCDWLVYDNNVQSNSGPITVSVEAFPGNRFGGLRTWTILARWISTLTGQGPDFYFSGTILLDNATLCKGTHVVANDFTSFCPVPNNSQNVGWGGSATLVVS